MNPSLHVAWKPSNNAPPASLQLIGQRKCPSLDGAGLYWHALPASIVTAQTAPLLFCLFMVEKEKNDKGKRAWAFINFTVSSE